ncbi:MAG: ribosome recycling factor [Sulfobacillus sp.]
MNPILADIDSRMAKSVEVTRHEMSGVRAGRASPALLERIMVDYYGSSMPLNQVAQIQVPEARLLLIQPWDKSILPEVERALMKSDLGLTPNNDGAVIRLQIPPLTEERRRDLVKVVHKKAEEERVAIRNLRREAMERIGKEQKDGRLSEDEASRLETEVQKLTDHHVAEVDALLQTKERDIMEV